MNLLKIEHLVVRYGNITALHDVSLEVEEGKIITVIGANGAGKTTLLRSISGELPKAEGKIIYRDMDITHLSTDKIVAQGIIQVPEGRQIFGEMSVSDNLKMGAFNRRDKENILQDMDAMYELFPVLKERRNQKGGSLSGGEQQQLALARGLMARPKLLLLDEPSMGVAPIIVKDIFKSIQAINRTGITIILIEQNAVKALKISDYAYVLESGKIRLHGKARELANNDEVKKVYLGADIKSKTN